MKSALKIQWSRALEGVILYKVTGEDLTEKAAPERTAAQCARGEKSKDSGPKAGVHWPCLRNRVE